jgi:putative ABC transport system permease protein
MTAIGVVIGTAAVIILISLAAGLQRSVREDLSSIGELTEITVLDRGTIRSMGGAASAAEEAVLNDQALAEFRGLPGVTAVTPRESLNGAGRLRFNRLEGYAQIEGIDPVQAKHLGFELASGTTRLGRWQALAGGGIAEGFYNPRTGLSTRRVAGEDTRRGSGRGEADAPDLQGQALQLILSRMGENTEPVERIVRLRVTGVLEEEGSQRDNTLYLALDDVVALNRWFTGQSYNPGREGYNQALVKVANPDQTLAVEREILSRGFIAWSARSVLQEMNTIFLVIQGIFGGIGGIALIVAAFGIANTMLMAIYERTREIGLMKAVGATNRDVMTIFLTEAGAIGLLGGIGGILLGVSGGALIDLIAGTYLATQAVQSGADAADVVISIIHTPLWLPIFALVFSSLVGVISGVYPAVRAASLDPIAALRYE